MYILAIDQGTSSTKTLIFDAEGNAIAKGSEPLHTMYLNDGFVEQDPEAIFKNVEASVQQCINEFESKGYAIADIQACGISNQRETFVVWDQTGKPLHNAVVWQCKRSIQICERLKSEGYEKEIKDKTGLIIDPYFSGTKLLWLLENNEQVRLAIEKGEAYFGTVDTWLLYKMTGGTSYYTDYSNASRTLFFNLHTLTWDKAILEKWGLEKLNLPEIKPSSANFGNWKAFHNLPITAMIGDSHAAAFGEGCFSSGTAKATLGTGCSILMNIGAKPKPSENGMLTTICWSMEGRIDYALEGAIVSCGSTIEWLKNELGLFEDSQQTQQMAEAVSDNNGVYIIPAFSGLGAPHWDMARKASINGMTFGSTKNHIVRAALESIPYQIKDVIIAMEQDAELSLKAINTDGGITANSFIMQFLADLLDKPVTKVGIADVSALGAAYLAGLQSGLWENIETIETLHKEKNSYTPCQDRSNILEWYAGWKKHF
jgi:glycerol kinase